MRFITNIRIDMISIPPRLRPVDDSWVEMLAASIDQHGLRQGIIVRPDPFHVADKSENQRFLLVAGSHRLAAVKRLGKTEIDAEILELNDLAARLVEIDENLARRELSVFDRAIFLTERKRLYEELYPHTAQGKAKKPKNGKSPDLAGFPSFSAATAAATGISRRSVERLTQMVKGIAPEARDLLRTSKLADNGSQLLALAEMDPADQVRVATEIVEGRASSLSAAQISSGLKVRANIDEAEVTFQRFLGIWSRAGRPLRKRIRDFVKSKAADDIAVPGEDQTGA